MKGWERTRGSAVVAVEAVNAQDAQLERVPGNEDVFRVPLFTIYDLRRPLD